MGGIAHSLSSRRGWEFWVWQPGLYQGGGSWFRVTPWPTDPASILALMVTFRGRARAIVNVGKREVEA